jgi:hypothetical protein
MGQVRRVRLMTRYYQHHSALHLASAAPDARRFSNYALAAEKGQTKP